MFSITAVDPQKKIALSGEVWAVSSICTDINLMLEIVRELYSYRRTPYFHFEQEPNQVIMKRISDYEQRYGLKAIIDTKPF